MDCASKRITQGHRILKPKQVRREIIIPSLPFHTRAKPPARNSAKHFARTLRTPRQKPQRSKCKLYLLNINILIPLIWITPLGLIDPLVLFFYKGGMLNNP